MIIKTDNIETMLTEELHRILHSKFDIKVDVSSSEEGVLTGKLIAGTIDDLTTVNSIVHHIKSRAQSFNNILEPTSGITFSENNRIAEVLIFKDKVTNPFEDILSKLMNRYGMDYSINVRLLGGNIATTILTYKSPMNIGAVKTCDIIYDSLVYACRQNGIKVYEFPKKDTEYECKRQLAFITKSTTPNLNSKGDGYID